MIYGPRHAGVRVGGRIEGDAKRPIQVSCSGDGLATEGFIGREAKAALMAHLACANNTKPTSAMAPAGSSCRTH